MENKNLQILGQMVKKEVDRADTKNVPMLVQQQVFKCLLWCSVITIGLWVGGTLFHILVVEPLWTYDPPTSVVYFFKGTPFNRTIWNFFGPPWMAARLLPLLLCILLCRHQTKPTRHLLIIAGICWVFITVYTLVYIYPINDVLFLQAGGHNSPMVMRQMVDSWLLADRLRFIIGSTGYLCLLQVFAA